MAAGAGRLRPGGTAVAAAVVVMLLGSATAWAVSSYDARRSHRSDDAAAAGALSTLDRRAQGIIQIVGGPTAGLDVLRQSEVPATLSVAGHRTDGQVTIPPDAPITPAAAAQVAVASRPAMELARDTGEPQAGPVVDGLVPVAVAMLPSSAITTDQRRQSVTGWRLAMLSPRGLLDGLPRATPRAAGLTIEGARFGAVGGPTAGTVLVAGRPWTLAMAGHGAPVSRGGLATLGVTLLGALACLLADVRVQRALHRERSSSAALERETRTVAELGPLLQSSLDLAEVLPPVALRLSDEFGLSRFSVQLIGEQGHLIDVFAIGSRSSGRGEEVDARPAVLSELPAGVVGALPLVRTGRTIGRLSFVGRRELGPPQLAALSAAADLIAVATYNAELFEREQDSATRLRELDQLKDAFLSTISHELRTPLTAISGFVRLLRDRGDQLRDDQRKEFLDRVHGNTLSLGLLVDDLLDFARLERQALNAPPSPMELDRQVAKTLAQLAPVLGQREVVVELEPVRAQGNAGALERVLANLLTNAAKFSDPDSRIVVSVRADGDAATLEVADQGAGIAEADRERVFARFYRGDSDAARGTRGAGIGLSVVRELVHQMGGTVAALPNTPRGTRMVVRLPLEEQLVSSPNGAPVSVERTST